MKKIIFYKNLLYFLLILFISIVPIISLLFFSHDNAYFDSPNNIQIVENNSKLSTNNINEAITNYANEHHLVLTKRIYIQKGNGIIAKTAFLGKNTNYVKGIPQNKVIKNNDSLLADYGIFGPGDHHAFMSFLANKGVHFMESDPTSWRSILIDITGNYLDYHFDYLLIFLIIIIVMLNSFIIFKRTRYIVLNRLFKGRSIIFTIFSQLWDILKWYLYSFLIITTGVSCLLNFIAPDILKISLKIILLLSSVSLIPLIISTFIIILVFDRFNIVDTIKGRIKTPIIPILSCLMMSFVFFLFVNLLNLNQQNQVQLEKMQESDVNWNKIADFNTIGLHSIPNSFNDQAKLSMKVNSSIPEDKMLLSMLTPFSSPAMNFLDTSSDEQDLYVNPTYFKYQKIKDSNENLLTPSDFSNPVTLLTINNVTAKEIYNNYSAPLGIKNSLIKVKKIRPTNVYAYLNSVADQRISFQKPKHLLVINLHATEKIPTSQMLKSARKDENGKTSLTNVMTTNIYSWISQQNLMVRFDSTKERNRAFKIIGNDIQEVNNVKVIRANLKSKILFAKDVIYLIIIMAVMVMIMCGYFTTKIIFMAYRKKLFIKRAFGARFIKRYLAIYVALTLALVPGFLYSLQFYVLVPIIILVGIIFLGIFTYQIYLNEKQTYKILKGDL